MSLSGVWGATGAASGICLAERRKAVAKLYRIRLTCRDERTRKSQAFGPSSSVLATLRLAAAIQATASHHHPAENL